MLMELDFEKKLIEEASRAEKLAPELHRKYHGKIEILPKCPIRGLEDFAVWYTPGVAAVCREIAEDEDKAFEYTNRSNTVAIATDGSRTLGLGNIGAAASLPVMEGKALLFKYLGGVDAFPLVIQQQQPEKFVEVVKAVSAGFGGINLEDIATPKCFSILEKLKRELSIPVWHDDQHGTATATLAALINALKVVGKRKEDVKIVVFGVGAANYATINLLVAASFNAGNILAIDRHGILGRHRSDLKGSYKWRICEVTNADGVEGGVDVALKGADVLIAASKPGPGVIRKEWISKMNDDAIVFALANPVPEIYPWDAKEAGARIVATGRSDFPNQVNNSLVFPAVFRGVLDVRAKGITEDMAVEAALTLARFAEEKGLSEEHIIPDMMETEVFPMVAAAVGVKAIQLGIARREMSFDELKEEAERKIVLSERKLKVLMDSGLI